VAGVGAAPRDPSDNEIAETAGWLAKVAVGEGLTLGKLLSSALANACAVPSDWSRRYTAILLQNLISEAAGQLPVPIEGQVALAALNLLPDVSAGSPTARFKRLGYQEPPLSPPDHRIPHHPTAFARHWRAVQPLLARMILTEIERRNSTGWAEYARVFQMHLGVDLQPFVVNRLEVTYFVDKRRVCTETITQRWLKADLSHAVGLTVIDHYKVRAKYQDAQDDQEPPSTEILPMLNCRAGEPDVQPDGWLMTPMYFPEPLEQDGTVFFASRVRHETNVPVFPAAFIQVTSLGIIELIMRVQFAAGTLPISCWVYGGPNATDAELEPTQGENVRARAPNQLGYVEYHTQNCPPGWYYTIGWKWDDV
jgi:hypothetical protein